MVYNMNFLLYVCYTWNYISQRKQETLESDAISENMNNHDIDYTFYDITSTTELIT